MITKAYDIAMGSNRKIPTPEGLHLKGISNSYPTKADYDVTYTSEKDKITEYLVKDEFIRLKGRTTSSFANSLRYRTQLKHIVDFSGLMIGAIEPPVFIGDTYDNGQNKLIYFPKISQLGFVSIRNDSKSIDSDIYLPNLLSASDNNLGGVQNCTLYTNATGANLSAVQNKFLAQSSNTVIIIGNMNKPQKPKLFLTSQNATSITLSAQNKTHVNNHQGYFIFQDGFLYDIIKVAQNTNFSINKITNFSKIQISQFDEFYNYSALSNVITY